jgi:hypothetical protein
MSRLQTLNTLPSVTCVVPGTAYPLTNDPDLYVKSLIVQSIPTNTGDVAVGDAASQEIYLTTGRSATIAGDNMDNGTSAKLQVASIYVRSTVANDVVSVTVLERL